MSEKLIVTMKHLRRLGYCASGCRKFAERHGIDFRAFVRDGIDADRLAATGDGMAMAAVEEAKHGREQ